MYMHVYQRHVGGGEDVSVHPQHVCTCTLGQPGTVCAQVVCKYAALIDTCTCKETCGQPAAWWTSAGQLVGARGRHSPGRACSWAPSLTLWISRQVGGGAPRGQPGSGCCEPLSESCRGPQAADVGRLAVFSHCPPPGGCNTGLAPHPMPFVVDNAPIHPASA